MSMYSMSYIYYMLTPHTLILNTQIHTLFCSIEYYTVITNIVIRVINNYCKSLLLLLGTKFTHITSVCFVYLIKVKKYLLSTLNLRFYLST